MQVKWRLAYLQRDAQCRCRLCGEVNHALKATTEAWRSRPGRPSKPNHGYWGR